MGGGRRRKKKDFWGLEGKIPKFCVFAVPHSRSPGRGADSVFGEGWGETPPTRNWGRGSGGSRVFAVNLSQTEGKRKLREAKRKKICMLT